ncbi:MAG: carotenoid oxygenase family protein [Alphaproteobacteria bacterium]|nr:carotenoid oxygenase family protein [Alphaproteobacteria bacterium]
MRITRRDSVRATLAPSNHPYLNGAHMPLHEEVDAEELDVIEGRIPRDIDGVYLRNTQNQVHQPVGRFHPFDGDGMLHAISFRDGRANYRNRMVRTKGFQAEQEASGSIWAGTMENPKKSLRPGWGSHGAIKDSSSTDVVVHAGQVLSTYYQCGEGYRLDPYTMENLGTEGWVPLDGISAHPKVDERTGELLFFNYSKHAPYMHYGVVDRNNRLTTYIPVPLPGPRLPHDMIFTANYSILNDFPLFWDPEPLAQGRHVVRFFENIPSRFAIIPRHGRTEDIRWFESSPTFVLHWINAYEDGDEIVVDGYHQQNPMPESPKEAPTGYERMMVYLDQHAMGTRLHRWRFNLRTGTTREERLDPRILEFGMMNARQTGLPYRYAYSAEAKPGWFLFTGLVKHDLATGASTSLAFGPDRFGSEAPFAPRLGSKAEDDGYLVSFITDERSHESECILVDAQHVEDGPVCRIRLPHKISSGTHATWASRADIEGGRLYRLSHID